MDTIIGQYKKLVEQLLEGREHQFNGDLHSILPTKGGVYRIFKKGAEWNSSIYVGKSTNLQSRIYQSHFMGNREGSSLKKKLIEKGNFADEGNVKEYFKDKCLCQFIEVPDEADRKYFEHFAIAILHPRYND